MAPPKGPKREVSGLVFPPGPKGDRSSTFGNNETIAASFEPLDKAMAEKVRGEKKKWRHNYVKYIQKNVELGLKSPEKALASAQAGMDWAYNNFEFVRDGKAMSLKEAMEMTGSFETGFIRGDMKKEESFKLEIPYKGKILKDAALVEQVQKWRKYGTIEPSCADAILAVIQNQQEWLDLSDQYFVLLGAGSAMGPFLVLMALGANVIAIDLDREPIWKRLLKVARESSGTLTFPISKPQSNPSSDEELAKIAGCNLFTQTPEIANWLGQVHPKESVTVGAYAYLDGARHVQVSLAMDAIIKKMIETRGASNVSVAYLCTPTDVHVIPEVAHQAAVDNYNSFSPMNLLIKLSPFFWTGSLVKNALKPIIPDNEDKPFYIVDGVVNRQGPNYILAKRIQHWRAMLSYAAGCTVSTNIAPSTSTVSVTKNKLFALAYGGMHYFKPFEVATPELSNSAMCALLIHDLRNEKGASKPKTGITLRNPLELFMYGSFHGGLWRCAYKIDSLGTASAVFYLMMRPLFWLMIAVMVAAHFLA
mmetsp:Transcript_29933/g.39335  ORF Transcript_29933/g.39335 Transcript_29933/m.39335 type:complete len:534 (+) Transcript_29933:58-1659(+)